MLLLHIIPPNSYKAACERSRIVENPYGFTHNHLDRKTTIKKLRKDFLIVVSE